jgi:hypothetical protein
MHNRPIAAAVALACVAAVTTGAEAQTLDQRVEALERDNARMREQLGAQEERIQGAPERVKELEAALADKEQSGGNWFENIEIAGVVELEAGYFEPFDAPSESDLALATFELGIMSQIGSWVEVGASLLYEEDDTDLDVDTAYITLYNPDVAPVYFTGGQIYVPFGVYETNLVSDPLTLELGETRETAALVGFEYQVDGLGGFGGSVYGFNGDTKLNGDNRISSWGANLGYAWEQDDVGVALAAGWINNLGDADGLQDALSDNRSAAFDELVEGEDPRADTFSTDAIDRTAGWTVSLGVVAGRFNLIGEYLSATDAFDADSLAWKDKGAKPSAWNVELGYSFPVFGKETVAAVAYQGTDEAVALELPKESWLVGWSIGILENTALSFEYRHDSDYSENQGGTGDSGNSFVAQLAVEF